VKKAAKTKKSKMECPTFMLKTEVINNWKRALEKSYNEKGRSLP